MFSKKEFAIVGNLRFISRKNFMLNSVEHDKSFITSGPGITSSNLSSAYITFMAIDHEIISIVILSPSADSRRAVNVSYWQKYVHKILVNRKRTKKAQEKCK